MNNKGPTANSIGHGKEKGYLNAYPVYKTFPLSERKIENILTLMFLSTFGRNLGKSF